MVIKKTLSFRKKSISGKMRRSKTKRIVAVKERMNKSQILTHLTESTEFTKKQVIMMFEAFSDLMYAHLKKGGAGEFVIPGLCK